jgi:DNA/RNA endonuclease YhcR with UshA esterase domain
VLIEEGQAAEDPNQLNPTGEGTQEAPYNVASAIVNQGVGQKWVEGYIVGVYNFDASDKFVFGYDTIKSNILMADISGAAQNYIAVQLPAGEIRTALNIVDNESNLGKKVKVYGSLEKYCGISGVKSLIKAEIDGKLIDCEVVAGEATPITVAEFKEKPVDSKVWYELTGVISGSINTTYGNFDLVDETGSVYVYGLTATPQSTNDKSYSSLGLAAGDKIKLRGTRGEYNGKIEVMNAYFVELVEKGAGEPEQPENPKPDQPGEGEAGSEAKPYTIEEAFAHQGAKDNGVQVWIEGYIVGFVDGMNYPNNAVFGTEGETLTNIIIAASADEKDTSKCLPVQLPKGAIRDGLNVVANPTNLGKAVKLQGTLEPYFGKPGIKFVKKAYIDGVEVK